MTKRSLNKLHKQSYTTLYRFVDDFHDENKKTNCATVFYYLMYNLLNLIFHHAPNEREIKKLVKMAFDEAKRNHKESKWLKL